MSQVTVYTNPSCGPCQGVKATLRRHKIIFNEVNLDEDKQARDLVKAEGFMSTPVLQVGQTFMGNPEAIIMWAKKNSKRDG